MPLKIVYSPECLGHYNPYEPEERVKAITSFLESEKKGEFEFVAPDPVADEDLLLVHSKRMVEDLKFRSSTGLGLAENPFNEKTFELIKSSCGCALKAARIADEEGFSFGITRPPGHHAGSDFYHGFCYANNIAVAVRKNQKGRRALIIDFDVHHGNGTQDIFYKDPSVYYFSVHQDPSTIFPFRSGFSHENSPTVKNTPLPPGSGDEVVVKAIDEGLKEILDSFKPEFIGVSAGFDIYLLDRISSLVVEETATFHRIGKAIKKAGLPTFAVLEGGYYLPDLGKNFWSFASAFK